MGEENEDIMKEKLGCGCCTDDSAILKAVNNAQAGRIEALERDLLALKEQNRNDLLEKTGLNKRLDDLTADYRVLWVQHQNLKSVNDALLHKNDILNNAKANLIRSNHGLQSKVAKQANEIKRLTEDLAFAQNLARKYNSNNDELRDALDQASKDAEDNFDRGYIKGLEELWAALKDVYEGRTMGKNQEIFGYHTVGEILDNLSPTWFMNRHHTYEEKEARDIKIGDEVVIISPLGSDDSDYGIVYNIIEQTNGSKSYHIIGSGKNMALGDRAITDGSIRKTGKHYDHIPFDYIG